MTIINLSTQNQQLINANKIFLAAGDVNSVELQVEFDSAWDKYSARSATFYTSKNPSVQEQILLNNKCVVPHDVLAESCVLFIGVRGITPDGEGVKTSSLVKYRISEGATAGDKTLIPTMDLYQQYLAALKEQADPVIAAVRAEIQAAAEASILKVEQASQQMAAELGSTTLWTNPNPEADFAKQTITFNQDATGFKTFRILFENEEYTISRKNHSTKVATHYTDGNTNRTVEITNTGASFGAASGGKNYELIPYEIIGYKY